MWQQEWKRWKEALEARGDAAGVQELLSQDEEEKLEAFAAFQGKKPGKFQISEM